MHKGEKNENNNYRSFCCAVFDSITTYYGDRMDHRKSESVQGGYQSASYGSVGISGCVVFIRKQGGFVSAEGGCQAEGIGVTAKGQVYCKRPGMLQKAGML